MDKTVVYFLDSLGSTFVQNDLRQFLRRGYRIKLFLTGKVPQGLKMPEEIVVHEGYLRWEMFKPSLLLSRYFPICLWIYARECSAQKKLLPLRKSMAILVSNVFKANEVSRILREEKLASKSVTFFSFWFYDCIFLALLKRNGLCGRAVVRTHGGDLFEERGSLSGKLLFRNFQLNYIDHVFSASLAGTEYLRLKYPRYTDRISTSYLGSATQQNRNPFSEQSFTIVTCAKIRNVKRIDFVAEVMLLLDMNVTWIHIGDENSGAISDNSVARYFSLKEELLKKKNLTFRSLGQLSGEAVFNVYNTEPVTVFLSLSAYEGLPVSMMEAASFGIPIISTDVGGCREIVNAKTGLLIPLESKAHEVAAVLRDFPGSGLNSNQFRSGVRTYWEQHFNDENTYNTFFRAIQN